VKLETLTSYADFELGNNLETILLVICISLCVALHKQLTADAACGHCVTASTYTSKLMHAVQFGSTLHLLPNAITKGCYACKALLGTKSRKERSKKLFASSRCHYILLCL